MGSPLASIIAEIFLQHINTKIQQIINSFDPKGSLIRYVDGGLYVSNNKNTNADTILKQINYRHPKIKFIEEKETHNKINYLDLSLIHIY